MKTITLSLSTMLAILLLNATAEPRPDFIPSTPPVSKAISDYTVADVLGVISTEIEQLPADHPYVVNKKYDKVIKADWPGAKISTNIDAMMQIVLDAPPVTDPQTPLADQIEGAWGNVEVFMHEIMDVPDTEKVDALLRTINAQTDNRKKSNSTIFAQSQFDKFLDPRLLALIIPKLNSARTYTELHKIAEGLPRRQLQVRREAKLLILGYLEDPVGMDINRAPFEVADEAAACAALKTWWTENLPLITAKCAEKKAQPNRIQLEFFGKPWDLRW
jgi:hypothetical protein